MFLTRHFAFVHMPKTGGNFVRRILEQHAPADWQLQMLADHTPVSQMPASHVHLPRMMFVRNPFSWYVSYFAFQLKQRDPFFLAMSDDGRLGFAASMRNVLTGDGPLSKGLGGFCQELVALVGSEIDDVLFGKIEQMREDLPRLLGRCVPVPAAMAAAIAQAAPENRSSHDHYSRYYDDELRQLVRERDAPAFERFGYEWEEPA